MGIFKKALGNTFGEASGTPDRKFVELVRAHENGEEWARKEIQRMWESNDETLIPRINRAYVVIYEPAARAGDRDAIIKYANGLAWSDRETEALAWYRKLIDAGDVDAIYELSTEFNQYGAFGQNEAEELKWLKLAAQKGHAHAQYKYGLELWLKDYRKEAAYWYQKAAENGDIGGTVKYAEDLMEKMRVIGRYMKGIPAYKEDAYDCVAEYGLETMEDCEEKVIELYNQCEEMLVNASDLCSGAEEQADIFHALSSLYLLSPENVVERLPYLGYYYKFLWNYIMRDGDCSGQWWASFWADIRREGLHVMPEDVNEWKRTDCTFDDWMARKGLVE